jgi:pimeloyl-ACP methyl ester carboxylesterase
MSFESAAFGQFATLYPARSGHDEPTLVFVHGVGLDQRIWNGIQRRLDGRHAALFYDLPGHGGRAQPVKIDDLNVYADDLLSLIDGMRIERAIIVGAAFGEFIARRFAVRYPDRVAGLVLLSPLWRRSVEAAANVRRRVDMTQVDGAESSLSVSLERWLTPSGTGFSEHCALIRDMVLATPHDSFMSAYRLYATMDGALADEAAEIACSVLLIAGEHDGNATPAMAQALTTALPRATACTLPGARHLISLDAPQSFAVALGEYLTSGSGLTEVRHDDQFHKEG